MQLSFNLPLIIISAWNSDGEDSQFVWTCSFGLLRRNWRPPGTVCQLLSHSRYFDMPSSHSRTLGGGLSAFSYWAPDTTHASPTMGASQLLPLLLWYLYARCQCHGLLNNAGQQLQPIKPGGRKKPFLLTFWTVTGWKIGLLTRWTVASDYLFI